MAKDRREEPHQPQGAVSDLLHAMLGASCSYVHLPAVVSQMVAKTSFTCSNRNFTDRCRVQVRQWGLTNRRKNWHEKEVRDVKTDVASKDKKKAKPAAGIGQYFDVTEDDDETGTDTSRRESEEEWSIRL